MAAISLPKPGTKYGPCAEPCQHIDCAQTRAMVAAACFICGKPIGYDTRFYGSPHEQGQGENYVHAVCYEEQIEQERKQRQ